MNTNIIKKDLSHATILDYDNKGIIQREIKEMNRIQIQKKKSKPQN